MKKRFSNHQWRVMARDIDTVRPEPSYPIDQWLGQYNHIRPHQALNMRAPAPETI